MEPEIDLTFSLFVVGYKALIGPISITIFKETAIFISVTINEFSLIEGHQSSERCIVLGLIFYAFFEFSIKKTIHVFKRTFDCVISTITQAHPLGLIFHIVAIWLTVCLVTILYDWKNMSEWLTSILDFGTKVFIKFLLCFLFCREHKFIISSTKDVDWFFFQIFGIINQICFDRRCSFFDCNCSISSWSNLFTFWIKPKTTCN